MARDILEALREDVGLFQELQARFSELRGAPNGYRHHVSLRFTAWAKAG